MTPHRPPSPVVLAVVAAAMVALSASPAAALCANCLGQNVTIPPALRVVGVFLLLPPAVFFAVTIAIRRATRASNPPGRTKR